MHEALWANAVRVDVEAQCLSKNRPGDFVAVGIFDKQGKKGLASNFGDQVVTVSGTRAGKGKPKEPPVYDIGQKLEFGFEVKEKRLYLRSEGKNRDVSSTVPKRMKNYRIGFRWNGRVKTTIRKVVIEGQLDDGWLLKKI